MPRANKPQPEWFDLSRYADAAGLTASGWLLNLIFRGWVARTHDLFGVSVAQGPRPILCPGDSEQAEVFAWHFFGREIEAPVGLLDLLNCRPLHAGVDPICVVDLYVFESRLPEAVRQAGARFRPGSTRQSDDPPAFFGRLDHAFDPQMTGRFVRVNLALPDSVLLHDLAAFLKRERVALGAVDRAQPYREAVREADKHKASKLTTLASIGLLPFLDLDRWAVSEGETITGYAMAELIGATGRMKEVRKAAIRCRNDLALRAWLEPAARGVPPKGKRSK